MKVKGINETQLREIVNAVSEKYAGNLIFNREPERTGNFISFTLRVEDSRGPGARRSHSGRRLPSACWHAHRDVMSLIFATNPRAILVSAMARYEMREGFERLFRATGQQNIGSMMQPLAMQDACDCC